MRVICRGRLIISINHWFILIELDILSFSILHGSHNWLGLIAWLILYDIHFINYLLLSSPVIWLKSWLTMRIHISKVSCSILLAKVMLITRLKLVIIEFEFYLIYRWIIGHSLSLFSQVITDIWLLRLLIPMLRIDSCLYLCLRFWSLIIFDSLRMVVFISIMIRYREFFPRIDTSPSFFLINFVLFSFLSSELLLRLNYLICGFVDLFWTWSLIVMCIILNDIGYFILLLLIFS